MNRLRARHLLWLAAAVVATALAAVACSSSSSGAASTQCNANPWMCGAGQTCWPTSCGCPQGQASCDSTNCIAQFSCVNAEVGKQPYDACRNSAVSVTCGDHQACIEVTSTSGVCLPYCDPANSAHACASNAQCVEYAVGSVKGAPSVYVCVTNTPEAGVPSDADRPDIGTVLPDGQADASPKPQ